MSLEILGQLIDVFDSKANNMQDTTNLVLFSDALFGHILTYFRLIDIYKQKLTAVSKYHHSCLSKSNFYGVYKRLMMNDWNKYIFEIHPHIESKIIRSQQTDSIHLFSNQLYTDFLTVINDENIEQNENKLFDEIIKCGKFHTIRHHINKLSNDEDDILKLHYEALDKLVELLENELNDASRNSGLVLLYKAHIIRLITTKWICSMSFIPHALRMELKFRDCSFAITIAAVMNALDLSLYRCPSWKTDLSGSDHSTCSEVLEHCLISQLIAVHDWENIFFVQKCLKDDNSNLYKLLSKLCKHYTTCYISDWQNCNDWFNVGAEVSANVDHKDEIIRTVDLVCDIMNIYRAQQGMDNVSYHVFWSDNTESTSKD